MRQYRSRFIACAAFSLASALATSAFADDDVERERLARISHEIQRLQVMVGEAGKQAPSGSRVKFRYDWLQRDLDLMRAGVADHLDAPRQPRPVPPLRGDYRQ